MFICTAKFVSAVETSNFALPICGPETSKPDCRMQSVTSHAVYTLRPHLDPSPWQLCLKLTPTQLWQAGRCASPMCINIKGRCADGRALQHQLYLVCVGKQAVEHASLARSDIWAVLGSLSLARLSQAGVQLHILGCSCLQVVGLRKALGCQLVLMIQQTLQGNAKAKWVLGSSCLMSKTPSRWHRGSMPSAAAVVTCTLLQGAC